MSRPQLNQTKYASITGPFPLKSGKQVNFKQIITTQTVLPINYSRHLNVPVTHLQQKKKENQSRDSCKPLSFAI